MSLATKYRPANLSDLIGQEILVETISNALVLDSLPQALLFTGTRGIGKTTVARIIAKVINCTKSDKKKSCNSCPSCLAIMKSNHPDVLEFDAASKTSVNDIREILDTMPYQPLEGKKKFYIIDEVHMLSNSAFNALLKTLEEPPSQVVFILATTDDQKIPLTILSRCLQFRLKPLSENAIKRRCNEVLTKEGYQAEEGSLDLIARLAKGSMRDALSILEGTLLFTEENKVIKLDKVSALLGYKDHLKVEEIFWYLVKGELSKALNELDFLLNEGAEPIVIVEMLQAFIHKITLEQIEKSQSKVEMPFLLIAWDLLQKAYIMIKESDYDRLELEMVLIKLAYFQNNFPDLDSHDELDEKKKF
jgi:DNA polymerase-3 subunit gamma/tau